MRRILAPCLLAPCLLAIGCQPSGGSSKSPGHEEESPLYMPNPPIEELIRLASPLEGAGLTSCVVEFCVDPATGKAYQVALGATSGYSDIDALCVETVESWRMRPHTDGRPRCSSVTFDLDFVFD